MKINGGIKTVLISIAILVALLILSIGLVYFKISSPTIIVTERIFSELENGKDIQIKVGSIDRNLRNVVTINDLNISYKEEEIAHFDSLNAEIGLFDFISFLSNGGESIVITADNGVINIPSISGGSSSFSFSSLVLPESLKKYNIDLRLNQTHIKYGTLIEAEDVNLNLITDDGEISLKGNINKFSLIYDDYNFNLNGLNINCNKLSSPIIDLTLDDLDVNKDSYNARINDIKFSLNLENLLNGNYTSSELILKGKNFTIDFNNIYAEGNNVEVVLNSDETNVILNAAELSGEDYSLILGQLSLKSTDYKNFDIALTNTSLELMGNKITLGPVKAKINTINHAINAEITNSDVTLLDYKYRNILSKVTLPSIILDLTYGDISSLDLSLSLIPFGDNESINDLIVDLNSNFNFTFSNLLSSDISLDIKKKGEEKLNLLLSGNEKKQNVSLLLQPNITLSGILDLSSLSLSAELNIDSYDLNTLSTFGLDVFKPFLTENSLLSLKSYFNLSYVKDEKIPLNGNIDYELKLDEVSYSSYSSPLYSKGKFEYSSDILRMNDINLQSNLFNLDFDGLLNVSTIKPELNFGLEIKDREILKGKFNTLSNGNINLNINFPIFFNTNLFLDIDNKNRDNIYAEGYIINKETKRDFSLSFDTIKKNINLEGYDLSFNLDYSKDIIANLDFDNTSFISDANNQPFVVDGNASFTYKDDDYNLSSSMFTLSHTHFLPGNPTINFYINGNKDEINLDEILVKTENVTLNGKLNLNFPSLSLSGHLYDSTGGDYYLSVYKKDAYIGLFRGNNIQFNYLGLDNTKTDILLTGRAEKLEDLVLSGTLKSKNTGDTKNLNANLKLDFYSLNLSSLLYTTPSISFSISSLNYEPKSGELKLNNGEFNYIGEHKDRNYPISLLFHLNGELPKEETLYSSILNIYKNRGVGTKLELCLDTLDIDNKKLETKNKSSVITILQDRLCFDGTLVNGTYNFKAKNANINLDIGEIAKLNVDLDYQKELTVLLDIDNFNLYVANYLFSSPLIVFYPDSAYGSLGIKRLNNGNFSLSGSLELEEMNLGIFWMPDQLFTLHHPVFSVWDNKLETSLTRTTLLDYLDYSRHPIDMVLSVNLTPNLGFDGYSAKMVADDNSILRLRLPLPNQNIDIFTYCNGEYTFSLSGSTIHNDGTLNLYNSEISIGMNPYPSWYSLEGQFACDLNLNFMKNNRIIYPAGSDPIISILLSDNHSIYFFLDKGKFKVDGDLSIRGGEVFYFQKYFYIKEGNISFKDPLALNPIINLKAALRDYDSEGKKVEIDLILNNSTFTNLNPYFESSPHKDINEIMSILGQSILPLDTYSRFSATSVVSLVNESIDVLSKVGIISRSNLSSELNNSIKALFGLDTFSIHTNIINNLLLDAISLVTPEQNNYSPLARYLNGTALIIGKYLTPNLYLQAQLHLNATENKNAFTFLSPDLFIDTEISLEWNIKPYTVTFFTAPKYFSLYSVMENFGFSIVRTINFN